MRGHGFRHVRRMSRKPVVSGRRQRRAGPRSKHGHTRHISPARRTSTQLRHQFRWCWDPRSGVGQGKANRPPERDAATTRCPQGQYAGISSCGVLVSGRTFCRVLATRGATMKLHLSANTATRTLSAQPVNSCQDLVERAEVLALAEVDEPLQISALCTALSVSERTLRKAFHRIRGLPPCRHLRMLRLSQARRALMNTDSGLSTVTEIATGCGFLELGRFSVEYRRAFGESPSQTLQRASTASVPVVRTAEHEDCVESYV